MAKTTKPVSPGRKKQLRARIATTLQKTFPELKKLVGEKKFNQHVKKASKVLAAGAAKKGKKSIAKVKITKGNATA